MGRRGELREVELQDPVEPDEVRRPSLRRDRGRWWLAVAAAVVGLGLGATQWVLTARENAAVARLQGLPGAVAPVDDMLEVVRTLDPQDSATLTGEPYGVLLYGDDGAQSYRWYAPADQGAGWTTPLLGPSETVVGEPGLLGRTSCVTDEPAGAATGDALHVVCLVTDRAEAGALGPTTTEVVVLGTADGSVLARWPVDGGTTIAALPGGVAVVGLMGFAPDDPLVVTAYDVLRGAEQWSHEDPWTPGPSDVDVFRAGDLVAVSAPDGQLTLLSRDGDVVRDGIRLVMDDSGGSGMRWGWSTDPRDGSLVLTGQAPDGTPRSTFVAADGDPAADVTVPGLVVRVGVDDASVPGLLLTADTSLYAHDADTGAARWTADVRSTTTALVLRGRVYVTTDRGVVALDGRTGRVVWRSAELVGVTPSTLLTDGRHVLVPLERTGTSGVPAVVAYDPASGTEVFRAPYPDGVIEVGALGRTMVGRDEVSDELVELR